MARYAAVCDQINDYISLSNTNLGVSGGADCCFGTFIRIPDNSGTTFKYCISNGGVATGKFNAFVSEDSSSPTGDRNKLKIVAGGDSSSTSWLVPTVIDWSVEQCVIVQRVSGLWSVWVGDSGSALTKHDTLTENNDVDTSGWELCRRGDGNSARYFGGEQSRFFYGDRGISQSEADDISSGTNPATVLGSSIVANYLFDEGTGSTISDTESAATGTLNNFPTDGSQWTLIDSEESGFQPAWAAVSNVLIQGG